MALELEKVWFRCDFIYPGISVGTIRVSPSKTGSTQWSPWTAKNQCYFTHYTAPSSLKKKLSKKINITLHCLTFNCINKNWTKNRPKQENSETEQSVLSKVLISLQNSFAPASEWPLRGSRHSKSTGYLAGLLSADRIPAASDLCFLLLTP